MLERPEPFRRPSAFGDETPSKPSDAGLPVEGLTRAQSKALSRCAPLTPAEFKARRRVAEQGLISLRGVLHADPDDRPGADADKG